MNNLFAQKKEEEEKHQFNVGIIFESVHIPMEFVITNLIIVFPIPFRIKIFNNKSLFYFFEDSRSYIFFSDS